MLGERLMLVVNRSVVFSRKVPTKGGRVNTQLRDRVRNVLSRHGYPSLTADAHIARADGQGHFDEYVAVHPEHGALTLYVRRGGATHLRGVASEVGGVFEGAALAFKGLDILSLDRKLGELRGALE